MTRPRLARQIGALAVTGVDVVAGRSPKLSDVLGDDQPSPAAWPRDVDDVSPCRAGTVGTCGGRGGIPDGPIDDVRIASLFAVTTFSLTRSDEGMRMIEIRARYQDGIAIWLDGVEVARQALPHGSTVALATRPHGPEWETFYVPIGPGMLRLGANTLAIEVHPSGRRQAPLLTVDAIARKDVGIVRGPVISQLGETTATVAVDTDPGLDASIEWGTEALDHQIASPPGRHHVFPLSALPAHGSVQYRIHAGGMQSAIYHLHTAPAAGDTIRIGVYGDVRGGHATHKRLVDAMLGEALDLVAVTGDMVLHGSDEADWQRFFAITQDLRAQVPYLPAIGNHDLGWEGVTSTKRRAEDVFALPPPPANRPPDVYWYSYDLADIHLVFLDSNAYEKLEQETWLDADLAAARKRGVRAILAFTHEPPYSRGPHRGNVIAQTRYVPILTRYRVDLLLAGHDHL
ncbi:MAG TPA: metallophosphoesterase, partial [Kofleriaceae bacterium]|nr:metallophosphoesterase [Kofleriaceae bacterium]